ncbi:HAMP domain-containing protein [Wenzhouxiangella sp. XN79A]|uniref:sensor histidine kinase n=1 Tax=Wenzhouxiangella sp. XN79A TaxID=2724193 RepID=UPI00144AAFA8|nr:ATP-binding protein [Wenzhouxiangella sp. XN79A]NKI35857.1 HAMP domain-containing protein [Wenzhouxiangella sp. XN79A]
MALRTFLKRLLRALPLAAFAGLLLSALFLVANVEQESGQLGRMSLWIFLVTGIALLVLLAAIATRLVRLVRDVRQGRPGARLRARLVSIFTALALPPVVIVWLFSTEFLTETIAGWLDAGTEAALADSIELGQLFLDLRTREARDRMRRIADGLPPGGDEERRLDYLFRQVSSAGPAELTLLDPSGQVEALVHIDPSRIVADLPSSFALSQAGRGQTWAAAEPSENGLQIRVLLPVEGALGEAHALQGIFPLPDEFAALAGRIEQAYFRQENVAFLRQRLQQSFVLILSLVLAMTALLAILMAFNAAKRVVRPIRELADATELMRRGEFPETLAVPSRDELGFLVESFNEMATELEAAQRELNTERAYLQAVLGRLSAGVLAFDAGRRLKAMNESAGAILGLDLAEVLGLTPTELAEGRPALAAMFDEVDRRIDQGGAAWRREIKLERADTALALVCRGSVLPGDGERPAGHVVVFDDVTELDQAQRQAAWAELAQRLAHEVKNPLTPIRLAAERLQLRLEPALDDAHRPVLDRATRTIIHQVDALRELVDAFGDYTRPGVVRREPLDIEALIRDVVELWTAGDSGVTVVLALEAGEVRPLGDPGQFRQILNNLIQNAREAHPDGAPRLTIRTDLGSHDDRDWLVLELRDDGPGFDPTLLDRVFEPYASTKPRGTGLGLAIVHRIVDAMGGRIRADNPPGGGARLTLELPVPAPAAK